MAVDQVLVLGQPCSRLRYHAILGWQPVRYRFRTHCDLGIESAVCIKGYGVSRAPIVDFARTLLPSLTPNIGTDYFPLTLAEGDSALREAMWASSPYH